MADMKPVEIDMPLVKFVQLGEYQIINTSSLAFVGAMEEKLPHEAD